MKKAKKFPQLDKQRDRCILPTAVIALTVIMAIAFLWLFKENNTVVIIDQLGKTNPNPNLVKSITEKFKQCGYEVDYVPPEKVTVDYYRNLPSKGYKYIILRAHSCLFRDDPVPAFRKELTFSTNELYTGSKFVDEQKKAEVAWLNFNAPVDETKYFGVSSRFVESRMQGNFNNATVIMMGCNGLTYPNMAEALLLKGVKTVIGWDKTVSLKHTDSAVELLVNHLLNRQIEVKEAVEKVMAEIGKDPQYGSKLIVYQ